MNLLNKILGVFDYYVVALEPIPNVITPTNRYYSDTVLDKAIKEYVETKVKKGRALCELHPLQNEDNPYGSLEISLMNASHMIVKIWKWKGKYKALIKLVPKIIGGGELKNLLDGHPDKVAFKLRGVGTTHPSQALDGSCDVINDDLRIISWDASPTGGKND